jgi:hypothetical protein
MVNYIGYAAESGSDSVDLYYVGTSFPKSKAVYKKELSNFLVSNPNNKTSFRLLQADLYDDEIALLKKEFKTGKLTARVADFLESLLGEYYCREVCCETGLENLIVFYCDQNELYFYDYKDYENVDKIFDSNPGLLKRVTKDYIKANY